MKFNDPPGARRARGGGEAEGLDRLKSEAPVDPAVAAERQAARLPKEAGKSNSAEKEAEALAGRQRHPPGARATAGRPLEQVERWLKSGDPFIELR